MHNHSVAYFVNDKLFNKRTYFFWQSYIFVLSFFLLFFCSFFFSKKNMYNFFFFKVFGVYCLFTFCLSSYEVKYCWGKITDSLHCCHKQKFFSLFKESFFFFFFCCLWQFSITVKIASPKKYLLFFSNSFTEKIYVTSVLKTLFL